MSITTPNIMQRMAGRARLARLQANTVNRGMSVDLRLSVYADGSLWLEEVVAGGSTRAPPSAARSASLSWSARSRRATRTAPDPQPPQATDRGAAVP
jgi:hypothetical protein